MNLMSRPEQNFDSERPDELDRSIDSVLGKYSAITPRPGLQERILANLRAHPSQASARTWWYWGLATAITGIALVSTALIVRTPKPSRAITQPGPTNVQPAQPQKTLVNREDVATSRLAHKPIRRVVHAARPAVAVGPKLDKFPSPQPLSAEEIALARYVANFPKDARLVAEAQEEFELETRNIMNDADSGTRTSKSIQPER